MNKIKRSDIFAVVFITVFASMLCAIADGAEPQKAFLDVNTILETWQRNYGNIKSMQVSYTERVLEKKAPDSDPNILDNLIMCMHIDRVEEGNRYHARESLANDGFAKPENILEYSFDGSMTREYSGGEKLGTIQSGPTGKAVEITNDLKKYMLLDIDMWPKKTDKSNETYWQAEPNAVPWFREIFRWASIKNFTVKVRPELETVAGKLCHVIEITKGDILLDKIWVAHECGMLPLKYQLFDAGEPEREILVEQVAQTADGDIWYPVKAYRMQSSKRFGKIKYEIITHSFIPNIKVDDKTFRFDFPNGTSVADRVLGTSYIVGVENK